MKTKQETLELILEKYLESGSCSTSIQYVKKNDIYFAISPYQSKVKYKLLRNAYSFLELYFPFMLEFVFQILFLLKINKFVGFDLNKLKNEKINYNFYAPLAIEKGARIAVVDTRKFRGNRYIYVPCVRTAFQEFSALYRSKFNIHSISLTGSCGKTTTKDLISSVLSQKYNTHKTKDSYNTVIGVCRAVLNIDSNTECLVTELSSGGEGENEIKEKCEVTHPTIGLITCIGKAHLEGFGDLNGVIKIKRQIFDYIMKNDGLFFLNIDDPNIVNIVDNPDHKWSYGQNPSAYIHGEVISNDPTLRLRWYLPSTQISESSSSFIDIQSNLFGSYNISNILAAIAIGTYLGIGPDDIRKGIESYIPENHRSQIINIGNITFIMDAYNANPTSMNLALDAFDKIDVQKKIVILGDMLELGHHSIDEHRIVLEKVSGMNIDSSYFVGQEFGKVGAEHFGHYYRSTEQLVDVLTPMDLSGATVLVKGSRGIALEAILNKIVDIDVSKDN